MVNLTQASRELFRRSPDERFETLEALIAHCKTQRDSSTELWQPPRDMRLLPSESGRLDVAFDDQQLRLNDWSFGQLCRLCGVSKDTVNRLTASTAALVLNETRPSLSKPLQLYESDQTAKAVHGTAYTRLFDGEVLDVVRDAADGFHPPPKGFNGGTGLYAGEQDMFCFLIDPNGQVEIRGENFAPGLFVWNSEVGRRSVGVSTFWYQHICGNHIVWDAVEVVELTRKHTAKVRDVLVDIQHAITDLVAKRDARRDGFARAINRAMDVRLGDDAEEVQKALRKQGVTGKLAAAATNLVSGEGYTVFALVDALTRLSGRIPNAGDRLAADQRAASLLSVAA